LFFAFQKSFVLPVKIGRFFSFVSTSKGKAASSKLKNIREKRTTEERF
jgi:hypothetical protein